MAVVIKSGIYKKKIAIVNMDNNSLAKEIASELKRRGFTNIVEFSAKVSYAAYYNLSNEKPDYTLMVDKSNKCEIVPCRISGFPHPTCNKGLGSNIVKRDSGEARKASLFYRHPLNMIGIDPNRTGSHLIPMEEVNDIPWYWEDKTPLLYARLPEQDGVADAVCTAIHEYLKANNKERMNAAIRADKESDCSDCKNKLKGSVTRG